MKAPFIFILLFLFNTLFGQNSTESELLSLLKTANSDSNKVKIYIDLHNLKFKSNVDKSEEYARQILKYGKASKILLWENKGYLALARCYRKRRQYNHVLKYDSLSLLCTQRSGNANSIFAAKLELAKDFLDADIPANAYPFLKECESLSEKNQNNEQIAKTQQALGWYHFKLNQNTKSIPYYKSAIKAFSKLSNEHMTTECKILLVQSLLPIGRTDSIPQLLFSALNFYNKSNSQARMAYCYGLLGQSFLINGDAANGIENYLKAKHLYNISNNKVEEALATVDLARTYLVNKDFKKAESFAKEAEAALTEMKYDFGLIIIKTFWGQFYSENNNYDLSKQYFIQADKQAKELEFPDLETENQRYWIQHLCKRKNYAAADSILLSYAEKSIKQKEPAVLAYEIKTILGKNKNINSEQAKILTLLYSPTGIEELKKISKGKILSGFFSTGNSTNLDPFPLTFNRDSVIAYNNRLIKMQEDLKLKSARDSLKIAQQEKQIVQQENQIEHQKSQQKILMARQDANQKETTLTLITITALISLAGLLLINKYRERAEKSRAEAETRREEAEKSKIEAEARRAEAEKSKAEAEKSRIEAEASREEAEKSTAEAERLKEIADQQKKEIEKLNRTLIHSTRNIFANNQQYINIEKRKGRDSISLETLKTRFLSSEILISKFILEYPSDKIILEEYLIELCNRIKETFEIDKQITIRVDAPLEVKGETAWTLGNITNEVVTNSFKYAFINKPDGLIRIKARLDENICRFQISDNGKGIDEFAKSNWGMTLIRDYADVLDGDISFINNNGTQFNLTFTLKD